MPRVVGQIPRPSPVLIERYRRVRLDVLAKFETRVCSLDPAIRLLGSGAHVVGPAVTVACDGADTRTAVLALGVAKAGDVIVVAAQSDTRAAAWGGGLTLSADHLGCEGVVVDGMIIDADNILERMTPVFSRGPCLRNRQDAPNIGSVNVPIDIGGVLINPGDLIFANLDGVCVVPLAEAEGLIDEVEVRSQQIEDAIDVLKAGKLTIFDRMGGRRMAASLGIEWED